MAELLTINQIPFSGQRFRYPKTTIRQLLTGNAYIIDGGDSDKFNLLLSQDTDFELKSIQEAHEYKMILRVDPSNASIPRPVQLFFSSLEGYCIYWKDGSPNPEIFDLGIVILYRSRGIIYAEMNKEYELVSGSTCS